MKKVLKLFVGFVCGMALVSPVLANSENEVGVYVNSNAIVTDQPAEIIQGRTMVPLRAIVEALNCEVEWDNELKLAMIVNSNSAVAVQVGNTKMMVLRADGSQSQITIDVPPMIINERILVPVRAISEGFMAEVGWNAESRRVDITYEVEQEAETAEPDKSDPIHIKITLTNNKEIEADLYPHVAPKTVENFVKLINEKFYDGLVFHRVIEGFMIQGGGYDKSFYDGDFNEKKTTDKIEGEFASNGFENNLKHKKGVLSMARTSDPNSASSQFFIMHEDAKHLDGEYAAFGEVTKGMDVVDEIACGETKSMKGSLTLFGQECEETFTDIPAEMIGIKTIKIVK